MVSVEICIIQFQVPQGSVVFEGYEKLLNLCEDYILQTSME